MRRKSSRKKKKKEKKIEEGKFSAGALKQKRAQNVCGTERQPERLKHKEG